jgi:hypothetical protein
MAARAATLSLLPAESMPPSELQLGDAHDDRSKAREFSFRLELWDVSRQAVELILAVAISPAIAFAAFNAALSEYPRRYITLRRGNRIVTSSDGLLH